MGVDYAVRLEEDRHVYISNGKEYASVTAILQSIGINDLSGINPAVLEKARLYGNAVHSIINYYHKDALQLNSIDPQLLPVFDQWRSFLKDYNVKKVVSEIMMVNRSLEYAGTLDIVAEVNGKPSIIDVKTATMVLPHYAFQTMGYKLMCDDNEIYIDKRYIWRPTSKGYDFKENKKDIYDRTIFMSALNIFKYRKEHSKYAENIEGGYLWEGL